MYWLALWIASSSVFNFNTSTGVGYAIQKDSNAYESVSSTQQYVNHVIGDFRIWGKTLSVGGDGTLGEHDGTVYRAFRAREQGITYSTNGTAKINFKASTPVEYIIAWNRNGYVQPIDSGLSNISPSVHYSISLSSSALVNYIQTRHKQTGENCKVYLGSQELKLKPELHIWVR